MQKITIAIDGYSSTGKSSTAYLVAEKLGYTYIDSGAMYRAVTLYFLNHHISNTSVRDVEKALEAIKLDFRRNTKTNKNEIHLNGLNVEGKIRTMEVSNAVSPVSAIGSVREAMVASQQKMGKSKGVVMDGRDIGTVVFPDAELKLFMVADPYIRAHRRQLELVAKGELVDLKEILANIEERDLIDTTRAHSPLRKAAGAVEIDTSFLTLEEQIDQIIELAMGEIFKENLV